MPLGGMVPLINMMLGEIIYGGVGSGLYGFLLFAIVAVFVAGLMVGRTPEYLGKKIEAKEVKMTMLAILCLPLVMLGFTAVAVVLPGAVSAISASGPHGFTEALYAYVSGAANNGSAFAGLSANTPYWNTTLAFDMLVGRFFMIIRRSPLPGRWRRRRPCRRRPAPSPPTGRCSSAWSSASSSSSAALPSSPLWPWAPSSSTRDAGRHNVLRREP